MVDKQMLLVVPQDKVLDVEVGVEVEEAERGLADEEPMLVNF